ncbi:helix-turn-helix domain-containing protein [Streptomyces sp. NPDC003691]
MALDEDDSPKSLNPLETFGVDVREMRRARRMTLKGLGNAVGYSVAYVSKVENAKVVPSERFAEGCDRAFGTGTMMARQRQAAVEGDHPSWFLPYLQHERKATRILNYSTLYVMGLLQTPEYARALYESAALRLTPTEIEIKLAERIARRDILDREDPAPPVLWVVLQEACLRVVVGDRGVMARQISRLLDDAARPNVNIQLLPFSTVPAADIPFTLLTSADRPTVLHADGPIWGRPQDAPLATGNAVETYDRLRADALGLGESLMRIRKILEEYAP